MRKMIMNNKYQPIKQCSCRMCSLQGKAYPNRKNNILNPEMEIDRMLQEVKYFQFVK